GDDVAGTDGGVVDLEATASLDAAVVGGRAVSPLFLYRNSQAILERVSHTDVRDQELEVGGTVGRIPPEFEVQLGDGFGPGGELAERGTTFVQEERLAAAVGGLDEGLFGDAVANIADPDSQSNSLADLQRTVTVATHALDL